MNISFGLPEGEGLLPKPPSGAREGQQEHQPETRLMQAFDGEWHYVVPESALAAAREEGERLRKQRDEAITLAAFATNGWACHARSKGEYDEIDRLHRERRKLEGLDPVEGT